MTIDRWEIISAIASGVSAISSLIAILFVVKQLDSSNQIAKAQLINELERDISLHAPTYTLLTMGNGSWPQNNMDLTDEQRVAILNYISFFERVNGIINTKVLKIEEIDDMFGGRFFYLFNNPKVKEVMDAREIKPYLESVRSLYGKWKKYREDNNLDIPLNY